MTFQENIKNGLGNTDYCTSHNILTINTLGPGDVGWMPNYIHYSWIGFLQMGKPFNKNFLLKDFLKNWDCKHQFCTWNWDKKWQISHSELFSRFLITQKLFFFIRATMFFWHQNLSRFNLVSWSFLSLMFVGKKFCCKINIVSLIRQTSSKQKLQTKIWVKN